MKKTVLYDSHISLGAKMTSFAGYEMPLRYEGVIKEHAAARAGAAAFDTSHMGVFKIGGAGALGDVDKMLSCDIEDMEIGACRYGFMCNHRGGVIDDMVTYRLAEDMFMLVTNAVNEERVRLWLNDYISEFSWYRNVTESTAKIDIQGPKAPKIAAGLLSEPVGEIKFYRFAKNFYKGAEVIVSRTGYTGEIGFEIYCPVETAADLWNAFIAGGAVPAGLGARDTLRLEMGFPLYGNELSENINAAQAGFSRVISKRKDFIGSEKVRDDPPALTQTLRGIALEGRRSAHRGDAVLNDAGETVGTVTSGGFSPALGYAVALAYVDNVFSEIGVDLKIAGEKSELRGKVCRPPFYKNATARNDIKQYL